jgi:hypothetical protein
MAGVLRLAVFDAEGRLVASSHRQPAGLDIGDRDYFRTLRDGPAALQVDRLRLRPDGQDVVLIAARRPGAAFTGVAVSTVPVTAFTDFFGRIAADARAAASLLRADGRLLVRHLPSSPPVDLPPDVPSRRVIAAGGSAVYEAFALTDRTWRLYGMSPVGDLPLYASFGVPRDAVIVAWLRGMGTGRRAAAGHLAGVLRAVAFAARRMQGGRGPRASWPRRSAARRCRTRCCGSCTTG